MIDLDNKLEDILKEFWKIYLPTGDQRVLRNGIAQIKQAFEDAHYMTSKEWYDKFTEQYHLSADWVSSASDMGQEAENDILQAAKIASNL